MSATSAAMAAGRGLREHSEQKRKRRAGAIDDAALISQVADPVGFLELCTSLEGYEDGTPTHLYPYQREIVLFEGRFLGRVKARQVGWSSGAYAGRAFSRSMLYRWHRGTIPPTTIFTSWTMGDDKEKMLYVRRLYESLPREMRKPLRTDNTLEIEFDNGARIICMHHPIGKGPADVLADEGAFIRNWEDVWRGALGMISRGGSFIVGGTPAGKGGLLWRIFDPSVPHEGWNLGIIPWYLCPDLCVDVDEAKSSPLSGRERVERYGTDILRQIRATVSDEDFAREWECAFAETVGKFFTWDLLLEGPSAPPYDAPTYRTLEELAAARRGRLFGGYDVHRTGAASELGVWEELADGRLAFRLGLSLPKATFPEQDDTLRRTLKTLQPTTLLIDGTGIGRQLAEAIETAFPGVARSVIFSAEWKERVSTMVKARIEQGRLVLPSDRGRLGQWNSIDVEWTKAGRQLFDAPTGLPHHGDQYWADALAIWGAWGEMEEVVRPVILSGTRTGAGAARTGKQPGDGRAQSNWPFGGPTLD